MPQVTSSMTPDLMGIVSKQFTPDIIRSVASQLSEDRTTTASALSAAVPSTLTALSDVASSDTGARHLKEVIDERRHRLVGYLWKATSPLKRRSSHGQK